MSSPEAPSQPRHEPAAKAIRVAEPGHLRRQMGRGALLLSGLALLTNGVNYASNLLFSRLLTRESFGDLTALLALSVVLAVPLAAAQTRIAERVASLAKGGDWYGVRYVVRHALAHLVAIAVLVTGVYVACIPLVVNVFDLQVPGPAIALAPLICVGVIMAAPFGMLQGLDRFAAYGVM